MVSTRNSLVAAGVGSLIGVGAVSAYVGLPELLREVVVSELEQRTGLPASVGSISVSPGGLTISALSVGDAERGAGARLDRVEIEAWPSSLAFEGISACRRVAVEGGHVRIPLGGRSGESGAPGAVQGSNPTARLPEVDLTAVSIELGDSTNGHESLRAVVAGSIRGDQAEVEITDLEARDGAHRVRVGRLRAAASLGARTLEVVEAEDVEVELDAERDPQTAFARARASLGLPAPSEPETVTAGADAPAVEVPPVPRLFGPSFRAEARNFRFRSNRGGVVEELANGEASLVRGETHWQTSGRVSPARGGRVEWNLEAERLAQLTGSVTIANVALSTAAPLLHGVPLEDPASSRVSGELELRTTEAVVRANGHLELHDLSLSSERLASTPVRDIDLRLTGRALIRPQARSIEVESLRVESGRAAIVINGHGELADDHYALVAVVELPSTGCDDALSGIPQGLLQELTALDLAGTIAARAEIGVDSRDLEATTLSVRIANNCRFEAVPALADLTRFQGPFTHRVLEPDGSTFEMLTGPGTQAWTPIDEISPFLIHAVLGHEDAAFFEHRGFSVGSIREALIRNLRAGRYVMGGSTISMQLTKNVFLRREKTLARKVQEVLLTWWLESAWTKEQILELYLNVIEYGPSVYGIRNASRHYFGVEPRDLSPAESAYLATILPNPPAHHDQWENGSLSGSAIARTQRFLSVLGARGRYDAAAVEAASREVPQIRFARPGDPPRPARTIVGHATRLPLSFQTEAEWEALLDPASEAVEADADWLQDP